MIIKDTDIDNIGFYNMAISPDHFASEKTKQTKAYIKHVGDYFANLAHNKVARSKSIRKNYDLMNGILTPEDYYEDPETAGFVGNLLAGADLPKHYQHYSILKPPVNTLVGEQSRRPDQSRVIAVDEDSKNEEFELRKQRINEYLQQLTQQKLELQGVPPEEIQEKAMQELQQDLVSYTSKAEKWANKVLNRCKVDLNIKELSEEAFRDLSICSRQYYHVYPDSSKSGLGAEVLNPAKVWDLSTPDKKYTSDVAGVNKGSYGTGTIDVMEFSEIIDRFSAYIGKEDIDHLRSQAREIGLPSARSNYGTTRSGTDTINYTTWSPLQLQEQMIAESEAISGDNNSLDYIFGAPQSISNFGHKFVVVQGYFISKKKVGRLTYADEEGKPQVMLVDESYKKSPNELEIEWGYVNQWYRMLKIGTEIYNLEPYDFLPYNPIIGVVHEAKNTQAKSIVDMMRPFQIIYNICMNQLFALLGKDRGKQVTVNLRRIPRSKDGDAQDDIALFEEESMAKGIMYEDNSPENAKVAGDTSVSKVLDMDRSNEMQTRYNIAVQMKQECWELVGISRQRTGSTMASDTATGINTALSQSYAQTEPLFAQHEYVLNQFYQALIDACQYIETRKDNSTLLYLNSDGDREFIRANPEELTTRDLQCFVTSRSHDMNVFNKMQGLAETMLQNGVSAYEISLLYSTNSVRMVQDSMKRFKEQRDAFEAKQQEIQQQQIEQQREAVQMQIKSAENQHNIDQQWQSNENRLKQLSEERREIIRATGYGKVSSEDANGDGIQDALEFGRLEHERENARRDNQAKQTELYLKNEQETRKAMIEREKLQVARENMQNDLQIAVENRKGRAAKTKAK